MQVNNYIKQNIFFPLICNQESIFHQKKSLSISIATLVLPLPVPVHFVLLLVILGFLEGTWTKSLDNTKLS